MDALLLGEADETTAAAVNAFFETGKRSEWLDSVSTLAGAYIPERDDTTLPAIAKATDALLPARSAILAPEAELSNCFCSRARVPRTCSFCVMRRSERWHAPGHAGPRALLHPRARPQSGPRRRGNLRPPPPRPAPRDARRSGQAGLALVSPGRSDRPQAPDRRALRQSGARTFTVASDAASQRLRRTISKGTTAPHLIACARLPARTASRSSRST